MGRKRTIVVGAGLSGLACAFDLMRAGHDVRVLEALPRRGGVVDTIEREGFRFETGPNTVPASADAFVELCADLGLTQRLVVARAGPRWLWFQGALVALPSTPAALMRTPLLSRASKWRILTEPLRTFVAPDESAPEPTFEAFLTERIGREATRRLAGAFVRGVYAAEIGELGARSAFPRLWALAERHGGLLRGAVAGRKRKARLPMGPAKSSMSLLSFPRGFVELVEALERWLEGRVESNAQVHRIERNHDNWVVTSKGRDGADTVAFADHVVLCTSAYHAAELLEPAVGARVDLSFLRAIAHASVTVVHLGFEKGVELPDGFGYLVPPDAADHGADAPRALGTIFASNLFDGRAPAGGAAVASFYRSSDVADLDAAQVVELAVQDLARVLPQVTRNGASANVAVPHPRAHFIRRWTGVIPRYAPGHARRMSTLLADLRERERGLHLGGASTAGVSVGAVIARGRELARDVLFQERYG